MKTEQQIVEATVGLIVCLKSLEVARDYVQKVLDSDIPEYLKDILVYSAFVPATILLWYYFGKNSRDIVKLITDKGLIKPFNKGNKKGGTITGG